MCFLHSTERKIAAQAQEINQRGTFSPLSYVRYSNLSSGNHAIKPYYVEIQWNYTVKFLFEAKDISYKSVALYNAYRHTYRIDFRILNPDTVTVVISFLASHRYRCFLV